MIKKVFILFVWLICIQGKILAQDQCDGGDNIGQPGCPMEKCKTDTIAKDSVVYITAGDPNLLVGPTGYDSVLKWVSIHELLPYTINFENDPDIATAPAQKVIIYMPIDPKLNPNALRIGNFGFGSFTFTVPTNTTYYTKRLDVSDSLGVLLDVTAGLDAANRRAFWVFQSIDPATGLAATLQPNTGFLPVNDSSKGNGQGYVTLTIQPDPNDKTRDTASATASITFDLNDPLPTNAVTNTIDAVAPTSRIVSDTAKGNIITVSWTGKDDPGGSGVASYDLYSSENGGPFTLYKSNITDTVSTYEGTPGSSYCFFTLAADNTGNKETMKKDCEGFISVGLNGALPITWLYFNGVPSGNDVQLNWGTASEFNTKEFFTQRSTDGIVFEDIGSTASQNNPQTNNYQYLDTGAMLKNVNVLYYRIKEVDKDGKYIYSRVISVPIHLDSIIPQVKAYPNPFDEVITLQIINVTNADKTNNVSLYTIQGQLVYNRNLGIVGPATILLDGLSQLTAGTYILKTSINGKLYTVKMIKTNR